MSRIIASDVELRWFLIVVAALAALVLAIVAARAMFPDDQAPRQGVSPECTEADLADGACLTYDDIRNQPTYTQEPTP